MRIAVISSSVFPIGVPGSPNVGLANYGGLEEIAYQVAKGLGEKGHDVYLFAPEGSICPGVTVIPIGPPGQWDEAKCYDNYWQQLLQFNNGGVIIDHSWQKYSSFLKMEGRINCPILGVIHAPVNTVMQELPPYGVLSFVCISEDQGLHFKGLFSRDCRVALHGIDTDLYAPVDCKPSDRYLFLARFSRIKGPHLAQDACLATNSSLDLIGDTSITNEPDYLVECKRKADGKQIKFVGPAIRRECVWWFSQARALLHTAREYREPFGLAPVEAQACGCPVLAFDYGAMRETVKHKETGFLVRSYEEAVNLLKIGALDALSRKRCREWVLDNFKLEKMIETYHQLSIEAVETGGW